ncbi:recombinase family protein [Glycomyces xiaoerkulensis]|uniref:recombinase family protein n=1 Tax=Glycomyces xiaoerkulensis TaxID=2038139 RepID=UPI0012FFDDE7|nr:recombinase family protein [Glycomyces xiaoerkulensis]
MAKRRATSKNLRNRIGLRIVGVVRLSRVTDVTTSPERQREAIERWAAQHGHMIVGWAEDLDVSGSTDPWERDELGPWLAEQTAEFDGLCAAKIDRWARSIVHFSKLLAWCDEHEKLAATADGQLNTVEPSGKLIAYVAAIFAEMELDAISERVTSTRAKMRASGRWPGGPIPFGYRTVNDDQGRAAGLAINPTTAEWARKMVAHRLAGWSFIRIAEWLNNEGVTGTTGKRWSPARVGSYLGSRVLVGQAVHDGRVVTDEAGEPIQFGEPLISEADFQALRQGINNRNDGTGVPRATKPKTRVYLLKDFIRCGGCGNPMYKHENQVKGKWYARYGCKGRQVECSAPGSVSFEATETALAERFLDEVGDQEVYERKFVPATGTAARLERLNRTIADMRDDRAAGLWEGEDDEYRTRMKVLIDKRRDLEAQPTEVARWEHVPTGVSYGQAWEAADLEGRRDLLAAAELKVVVCRETVDTPAWFDPDRDTEFTIRACRVYATWNHHQ